MAPRAAHSHPRLIRYSAIALAGVLAFAAVSTIAEVRGEPGKDYVEGEVLVRFAPQFTAQGHQRAVDALGGRAEAIERLDFDRVYLPEGTSVAEAVERMRGRVEVESVQPNFIYRPVETRPNDPRFQDGTQWALENDGSFGGADSAGNDLDAPQAWDHVTDCSTGDGVITVAVIDTGLNHEHVDFGGADSNENVWSDSQGPGRDFVDDDNDPMPVNGSGHGTHVAGLIGALGDNDATTTGVCWNVEIMALRALGVRTGTTDNITEAVNFAVDNGADIINMSLGGSQFDQVLKDTLDAAGDNGVALIAAAGNEESDIDGTDADSFPCEFDTPELVCVAALDPDYNLATFSNLGEKSVDVGAPGVSNASTWPGPIRRGDPGDVPQRDRAVGLAWSFNKSGSTGWGVCTDLATGVTTLDDPSDRCNTDDPQYDSDDDDRAWTDTSDTDTSNHVDFSGLLGAGLLTTVDVDIEPGTGNDFLVVGGEPDEQDGDPFNGTNKEFEITRQVDPTEDGFTQLQASLAPCLGEGVCPLGFQLQSDADDNRSGISVQTLDLLTVESGTDLGVFLSGTSMAAPHVAGVAAMLRAFNPDYTAKDVKAALLGGGEPVGDLAETTVSGNAVNAMGALAFIRKPTKLKANVVQQ